MGWLWQVRPVGTGKTPLNHPDSCVLSGLGNFWFPVPGTSYRANFRCRYATTFGRLPAGARVVPTRSAPPDLSVPLSREPLRAKSRAAVWDKPRSTSQCAGAPVSDPARSCGWTRTRRVGDRRSGPSSILNLPSSAPRPPPCLRKQLCRPRFLGSNAGRCLGAAVRGGKSPRPTYLITP